MGHTYKVARHIKTLVRLTLTDNYKPVIKRNTIFFSKKKTSLGLINFFYELFERTLWVESSVIRQKGESLNGCFKKIKQTKFSEKRTFRTPWYKDSYPRTPSHFKISPFALLPAKCSRCFKLLTYSASTPKSSPTHAIRRIKPKKCLSVFADELCECAWLFCVVDT